jgi:hypothetical protein
MTQESTAQRVTPLLEQMDYAMQSLEEGVEIMGEAANEARAKATMAEAHVQSAYGALTVLRLAKKHLIEAHAQRDDLPVAASAPAEPSDPDILMGLPAEVFRLTDAVERLGKSLTVVIERVPAVCGEHFTAFPSGKVAVCQRIAGHGPPHVGPPPPDPADSPTLGQVVARDRFIAAALEFEATVLKAYWVSNEGIALNRAAAEYRKAWPEVKP